jgi:hypothetical protein
MLGSPFFGILTKFASPIQTVNWVLTQVRNLNQRLDRIIGKQSLEVLLPILIGDDFVGSSLAGNLVYDLFPTVNRSRLCFPEYLEDRKSFRPQDPHDSNIDDNFRGRLCAKIVQW